MKKEEFLARLQQPVSNYEITKRQAACSFARHDQEAMIRRFRLDADEDYLYIRFLSRPYRVNRVDGTVTWSEDGFASSAEAGFNEAMTLYDVLCGEGDVSAAAGEFASLNHLVSAAGKPEKDGSLTARQTRLFDGHAEDLARACEKLGGTKYGKGDVAYRLPVFDFLPAALQFWESDDEFPASLHLLWDKNVLRFMRFETVWYAAGHLMSRLEELVENKENA